MPGRDAVRSYRGGPLEQVTELGPAVAVHAGHRGPTGPILGQEVVDDIPPELLLEIQDVERDADPVGRGAGVVEVSG